MIAVVYGTTGELIKFAPVLRRLEERQTPMLRLCTGQQVEQIPPMLSDFGLPAPELWLGRGYHGGDLEQPRELPRWFAEVCFRFAQRRRDIVRRLRSAQRPSLLIVHGDTMTTVIGAILGHLVRVPVAHIEAGLRSGAWNDPFPEELNRRAVTKLAQIHFAPGSSAVANLIAEQVPGDVVDTGHNTIFDNLLDIPAGVPPGLDVAGEQFGIVSLHRQELLYNRSALGAVLSVLRESAHTRTRLMLIDHSISAAAVDSAGLGTLFDSDRFVRIPRQRYFHFLSLLKASAFLVTDSGGSQEECAFLGHPCLIHRAVTERSIGLGPDGPIVISRMDLDVVRRFLDGPERFRTEPLALLDSPSDRVVRFLEDRGFVPRLHPRPDTQAGVRPRGSVVAETEAADRIEP